MHRESKKFRGSGRVLCRMYRGQSSAAEPGVDGMSPPPFRHQAPGCTGCAGCALSGTLPAARAGGHGERGKAWKTCRGWRLPAGETWGETGTRLVVLGGAHGIHAYAGENRTAPTAMMAPAGPCSRPAAVLVCPPALLQRLAAVRGRLSLCADQAAAAKWWLSMPMASVSAEGPMPKALSTRRTSPLMPGCRHQGRACPLRRARMTSNPLIVA